jgi:hypothetical protein
VLTFVGAAPALLAGAALAATAVPGATYTGSLSGTRSKVSISFRVSSDGGRVGAIQLSELPIYCAGSGPPAARIVFGSARISSDGTFTARGRDAIAVGPLKGTAVATLTLSGAFTSKRRERGVIRTDFLGSGSRCSGRSRYATRA